jgi:hypothetical protein
VEERRACRQGGLGIYRIWDVPAEVAKQSGFKLDQKAPIATVAELADYDAIIFGSGTVHIEVD